MILQQSDRIRSNHAVSREVRESQTLIWTSGRQLEFHIKSQVSQMLASSDNFEPTMMPLCETQVLDIVGSLVDSLFVRMQMRRQKLKLASAGLLGLKVEMDERLFSCILFNVVMNAIKFNRDGRPL